MEIRADIIADSIQVDMAAASAAFADLERADLERAGLERVAHRRRVAELCRRTARRLGVKGPAKVALVLAATEHGDGIRQVRRAPSATVAASTEITEASFECLVAEMAEEILRFRQGNTGVQHSQLEPTLAILDACDEFDDVMELAVLDRTPVPVAIREFFDDASPRFDSGILDALRYITCRGLDHGEVFPILPGSLTELPADALRLMRASDAASVEELKSIIASDPETYSEELSQELAGEGAPHARKVLLASCFGQLFRSCAAVDLWEHSKYVAIQAHELAVECGYNRDIAFVAGLLHDLGRLVTRQYPAGTRFEEGSFRSAGFPLTYAECLAYGTDHPTLGSNLLKEWNLPNEIVEAVAFHHSPENTKSVLAGILNLAEEAALDVTSSGEFRQSEAPWREMRRAAAARLTGIHGVSPYRTEQKSTMWSMAS